MKKFSEWVMALLFSGTLLVLMAATILLPKERYSYYENRNLSAFPEISVESVASGKVFGELETMFCDYAAWRTAALRAVTWCDLNLFHRPVVNEVVVTPDALLEELYTMPDTAEDILREADAVAADNAALRDQIEAYVGLARQGTFGAAFPDEAHALAGNAAYIVRVLAAEAAGILAFLHQSQGLQPHDSTAAALSHGDLAIVFAA